MANSCNLELFSLDEAQNPKVKSESKGVPATPQQGVADHTHLSESSTVQSKSDSTQRRIGRPTTSISKPRPKAVSSQRAPELSHPERLLRRREVEHRTGLSRSSLYRLIASGNFPAPINLSQNAVAWTSSSIDNWIVERVAASRSSQSALKERG